MSMAGSASDADRSPILGSPWKSFTALAPVALAGGVAAISGFLSCSGCFCSLEFDQALLSLLTAATGWSGEVLLLLLSVVVVVVVAVTDVLVFGAAAAAVV